MPWGSVRLWLYFHLAQALAVALPMLIGMDRLPGFAEFIVAAGSCTIISFPVSPLFPILIAVLSFRRRERLGVLAVVADIAVVYCHWLAVSLHILRHC